MRVRVLGPIEASVGGRPVPLVAGKQRALLAMLAVHANRTVSADALLEGLWGEQPPASAPKMVQQYVSQLRRALGDGGNGDAVEILTRGRGYELRVAPDEVDAARFERLVADGAAREALALWRGPPLADVADEPFAAAEIRRLEELRLTALAQAIDAELADGRHRELVAELEALVAEHPLSERLHGQLMLALYRSGRQADALEAYRRARATLVEQIGVEPGPELRGLHEAILRQDASLDWAARASCRRSSRRARRWSAATRSWSACARPGPGARGRGAVVVVSGPPGIGRTRLAAELARRGAAGGRARALRRARRARVPGPGAARARRRRGRGRPSWASPRLGVLCVVTTADAGLAGAAGCRAHRAWPARRRTASRRSRACTRRRAPRCRSRSWPRAAAACRSARIASRPSGRARRRRAGWRRSRRHAAAERNGLRRAEQRLAGRVVELQALRERADARDAEPATIVCPYKGLAPFDRADAAFFFGRERLVAEMVARLVGARCWGSWVRRAAASPRPCAPGCCPSWRAACCRAARTGRRSCCAPASTRCGAWRPRPPDDAAPAPADRRRPVRGDLHALPRRGRARGVRRRARRLGRRQRIGGGPRGARRLLRPLRRVSGAGVAARRQPRARRPDAARRAAPRDRAARAARRPARRARARRAAAGRRRRTSRVRCRCSRPRCSSCGSSATGATCASPPTSAPAACAARSRAWPRPPTSASTPRSRPSRGDPAAPRRRGRGRRRRAPARRARRNSTPTATTSAQCSTCSPTAGSCSSARAPRRSRTRRCCASGRGCAAGSRRTPRAAPAPPPGGRGARVGRRRARSRRALPRRAPRLDARLERRARAPSSTRSSARSSRRASRTASARRAAPGAPTGACARCSAGAAALLVLAVVAGVLFLDQRGAARDEARTAEAQRLGAQALVEHDLDRSLLLARQGVAIDDSLQTRSNLLAALMRSPAAIGVMRVPDSRLLRMALRPDGRALVVGDNRGTLVFLDPRSRRALRPPSRRSASRSWRSPSAPTARGSPSAARARSQLLDGHTFRRIAAPPVPDVEFANARLLARRARARRDRHVDLDRADQAGPERAAALRRAHGPALGPAAHDRRARRARRRARVQPRRAAADHRRGRDAVRARDARDHRSTAIAPIVVRDARTLRPLRRFPALAFAGAVSPDARTFAIGGQDGSVRFLDLRTGKLRTASGRHAGAVQSARLHARRALPRDRRRRRERDRLGRRRRAGDRDVPGPRRPRARGGRRPPRAHALHRGPRRQRHHLGPRRRPAPGSAVRGRNGKRRLVPLDGHQRRRPHARHPAGRRRRQPRRPRDPDPPQPSHPRRAGRTTGRARPTHPRSVRAARSS